ncbi:MAG: cupin domain-containing protein [Candidatus Aenigmarchaeota archaeon]|nr:cupin domain-containing protein [Candidatus Aenigmarchaeota archaeon]
MKPLKTNLREMKTVAKCLKKKVMDMVTPDGKNIYKNIKGHENEINYELYDLMPDKTGLKNLILNMNIIHKEKVNSQNKMTTGHSHAAQEEIYIFLKGSGKMILIGPKNEKYEFDVKPEDIITVPKRFWHRVVNTGTEDLVFINIFTGDTMPKSRTIFARK